LERGNYVKYKDKAWGIPEEVVNDIIMTAYDHLVREMLDETPLTISGHFKDHRTSDEYYADIIEGWLVEDMIVAWFQARGRDVKPAGSDKDRVIQRTKGSKITTQMDLIEDNRPIEIQMARQIYQVYHVKKGKGDRLVRENGIVMFIIIPSDKFFEVNSEMILAAELKPNPRWGGKECYWIYPNELTSLSYI